MPIAQTLHFLYSFFAGSPVLHTVGAYGVAIIWLTLGIRLVLWPLYQWQMMVGRKNMEDQRKLAPEMAVLRKKHKGDAAALQQAQMELYREHGINPLGGALGCLPLLVQMPVLTALYWVFFGTHFPDSHFLFIPALNDLPSRHQLVAGLPIPVLPYLIIPVLAGATTYVQSKMMQPPPNPNASEQELQMQQMTKSMSVMMPLMIAYFAISTPAGLGLYWFVGNCIGIIQQYFVNGGKPPGFTVRRAPAVGGLSGEVSTGAGPNS